MKNLKAPSQINKTNLKCDISNLKCDVTHLKNDRSHLKFENQIDMSLTKNKQICRFK